MKKWRKAIVQKNIALIFNSFFLIGLFLNSLIAISLSTSLHFLTCYSITYNILNVLYLTFRKPQ